METQAKIIDGKEIAKKLRLEIKSEVEGFEKQYKRKPGLSVVLIGDNEASQIYVNMKEKACKEVGIISNKFLLPKTASQEEALRLVGKLNEDRAVDGILVQLPLPSQLDTTEILNAISPSKDVDGFHPINVGRLSLGEKGFVPCTPVGVIKLIESTGTRIEGAKAVVVGRSNIVGKPVAALLMKKNATVTVCHSKTKDIDKVIADADILVAAMGKPEFVKGSWIKSGCIVIDVGVNRLADGKLVGDVEFGEAKMRASHITPVPGGVGPMTIAMLLENTLDAAREIERKKS
jgi:methylenetetrahydrofolate dehydrogenase (NADP+) / methenyltetrahydrofolate cyclohydrolase